MLNLERTTSLSLIARKSNLLNLSSPHKRLALHITCMHGELLRSFFTFHEHAQDHEQLSLNLLAVWCLPTSSTLCSFPPPPHRQNVSPIRQLVPLTPPPYQPKPSHARLPLQPQAHSFYLLLLTQNTCISQHSLSSPPSSTTK